MKKFILFFVLFAGSTLLVLVNTLTGCRSRDGIIVLKDVHLPMYKVKSSDTAENYLLQSMDSCTADSLMLGFNCEASFLMSHVWFPTNEANAYKREGPYFKATELIADIKIVLFQDYNQNFQAGTDIANACKYIQTNMEDTLTKEGLLKQQHREMNYLNSGFYAIVLLPESADVPALQQFAIELRTENNAVFRDTSVAITLLP